MNRWPEPPPQKLARWVMALRNRLRLLVSELLPALTLLEDTVGAATTQVLAAISRYSVADHLEERPRTSDELAEVLGLQAAPLHRLLRAACTRGYFRLDPSSGRFSNTRLSRTLLSSNPERPKDFCEYFATQSNVQAWLGLDDVLRTGTDGFSAFYGMTVWEWFAGHPDEQRKFARAMHSQTVAYASAIATTYPFSEIDNLCDLGGGIGTLISEIAIRHPHLKLTLYEVEGVLKRAAKLLGTRGVCKRVDRLGGSIFDSVPVAFQLYLLKNVLHDWDDDACHTILENVRHAMLPDSRLLIVEYILEKNEPDSLGALSDLQMMMVTAGGRERGLAEFDALLSRAGLRRTRLWQTATMSLIEAKLG
jgi:hypothetical protein